MTSKRLLKMQADVVARYRRVRDLWAAYYARSKVTPEVFGHEFYRAVGELLQGKALDKLELIHVDTRELGAVELTGRPNGQKRRRPYEKPCIRHFGT